MWFSFAVYPGFTYQIAVDGRGLAAGTVVLSHAFTPAPPPSDSFDAFLGRHFTAPQLADPAVSGPAADPDADGLANLLDYALALDPVDPARPGFP